MVSLTFVSATDPTDQYSLVYYAVNMAESIENQLNGGEPTFNTSSMQGGGMGGGGKGGPRFWRRKARYAKPNGAVRDERNGRGTGNESDCGSRPDGADNGCTAE